MKLSARLLLFLLVALPALPAHAKNPRWGKVVNVQIQGRSTSRQPEAPANPAVALPLAATLESASQCPRAIVAFRNASSATLTLTIGEAAPVQIAPKQTQRVCAQEDIVGWQVSSPHGWQYGGRLDVKGLRLREETLIAPGATLQIVNATGETQRLQLDGHDIGKLEAGKQKTVGPVDAGAHTLLARGKISQRRDTKRVRLAAGDLTFEGVSLFRLKGSAGRYVQVTLPLTLRLGMHLQAGRLDLDRVSVGLLPLPGRLGDPVRKWFSARITPLWRELRLETIVRAVEIQPGRALLRLDHAP